MSDVSGTNDATPRTYKYPGGTGGRLKSLETLENAPCSFQETKVLTKKRPKSLDPVPKVVKAPTNKNKKLAEKKQPKSHDKLLKKRGRPEGSNNKDAKKLSKV